MENRRLLLEKYGVQIHRGKKGDLGVDFSTLDSEKLNLVLRHTEKKFLHKGVLSQFQRAENYRNKFNELAYLVAGIRNGLMNQIVSLQKIKENAAQDSYSELCLFEKATKKIIRKIEQF
jgi:hypothetical protein